MVPPGPKATPVTPPSLTSIGSARSRSPFASSSTTPPTTPRLVSRGEGAPGAEGHARDTALLDLDRVGPEPLPLRVEQHHAAADDVAGAECRIPRRWCPPGRRPRS